MNIQIIWHQHTQRKYNFAFIFLLSISTEPFLSSPVKKDSHPMCKYTLNILPRSELPSSNQRHFESNFTPLVCESRCVLITESDHARGCVGTNTVSEQPEKEGGLSIPPKAQEEGNLENSFSHNGDRL